jgi:hypothetical protein
VKLLEQVQSGADVEVFETPDDGVSRLVP